MTDIVKQLRDTRYPGQLEMRLAAAAEIERLRTQLAKANDPTRDDTSSDLDIDLPKARPMGQS